MDNELSFTNPARLREELQTAFESKAASRSVDPLANDVRAAAYRLSQSLFSGAVSLGDLTDVVRDIETDGARARAEEFRDRHAAGASLSANGFAALLKALPSEFEAFRDSLNGCAAGVVFTAHPTFANSPQMRSAIAAFASGRLDPQAFKTRVSALDRVTDGAITLPEEHAEVLNVAANARSALAQFYDAALALAQERYPDRWREIDPALVSIASWVGYDLDGRTDIRWFETIRLRLEEKVHQLKAYIVALEDVGADLDNVLQRLRDAAEWTARCERLFAEDLDDPSRLVAAANALTGDDKGRLTSLQDIRAALREHSGRAEDPATQRRLHLIASEMRAYGLGTARIHLRVNAAQVRSALRAELNLGVAQKFSDRTLLEATAEQFASTGTEQVNFASLFRESMTARRQLMLCAQLLKHADADTPIRFLIAECEAPATVLGAIFLAKKFGVDHALDISPLFETPDGIERGGRMLERLLSEDAYKEYVRRRGVLSIQLGFSDSGRFIGQVAANMAIERLHILLAREMAASGMSDVRVILFNTHGESMGRGGFPGPLNERLDYVLTPWARARFQREGVALTGESSFQGGDGFLHFQTPELASATIASIIAWSVGPATRDEKDRFYTDINFSWDVYRTIKQWQEDLFDDVSYQRLLRSIGPNLLPLTGSRKVRRDSGASAGDIAKSLRAIPHNAILQQLAAPMNVFGGFGAATAREPDRFATLKDRSVRIRSLLKIAGAARGLSSLSTLRAYGAAFDPSFWQVRSVHAESESDGELFAEIARALEGAEICDAIDSLANRASRDRRLFDRYNHERAENGFTSDLYALHVLRLASLMFAFRLVGGLPAFSPRHDISRTALLQRVFSLDFAAAADAIAEIFPEAADAPAAFDALDEASDAAAEKAGYPEIHQDVVQPLRKVGDFVHAATRAIAHYYGAYG